MTGNGVKSAMKVYDTVDYDTAKAIATENLTKPLLVEFMEEYIAKNMPEEWVLNELRKDVRSKDKALRINALNNVVRIKGMITEKRLDLVKQKEELGSISYDSYAEKTNKDAIVESNVA